MSDENSVVNALATELGKDVLVEGYVAFIKAMRPDGTVVYACRYAGLSAMERLGMAVSFCDDFRGELSGLARYSDEDDE